MRAFPKIKHLFPVLLAAVMSLALSCEKFGVTPDISLSQKSVSSDAGHVTVSVTASGKWQLALIYMDDSAPWASLTSTEGRGSKDGIFLSYEANATGASRSLRVVLTASDHDYAVTFTQSAVSSSGEGQDPSDNPAPDPMWLELPALQQNSVCHFYYHDMTLGNGSTCRNYSFLWDKDNLVAHWVAYPLNDGLIGRGDRTDDWGYDPKVPRDDQPVLFNAYKGGYQKGHQLPSADRYVGNSNAQTFYFTNMTPQLGSLNGGIWGTLESRVRDWARASDTLYVVTGCVLDDSPGAATDNEGKSVTVPGGYFKALLSYKEHSTESYGNYTAAGFFFEHRSYSGAIVNQIMTIDELEDITGIDFFVNLPAKVGQARADEIEAADPSVLRFWIEDIS